jgi:hypothetical protein
MSNKEELEICDKADAESLSDFEKILVLRVFSSLAFAIFTVPAFAKLETPTGFIIFLVSLLILSLCHSMYVSKANEELNIKIPLDLNFKDELALNKMFGK